MIGTRINAIVDRLDTEKYDYFCGGGLLQSSLL